MLSVRAATSASAAVKRVAVRSCVRSFSVAPAVEESEAPKAATSAPVLPYTVPLRELNFVLNECLDAPTHYQKLNPDLTPDFIDSINQECAKFAENSLVPLYGVGDAEGNVYDGPTGDVSTPTGYKEAYQDFSANGWNGLTVPEEFGGQGMPLSMGVMKSEILGTANWAWSMYPGLSMGCMNTIQLHGSQDMKENYLTKLADGIWSGTMCLTEPHCGTDLGQVSTMATPDADSTDGSYRVNGTKVYISGGEHDMVENIVHIVLARTPGAPAGTRGISLFLVPKYLPTDGDYENLDKSNGKNVQCAGIETKMGIKSSATCVMSFENSKGFLIGELNDGLNQMFTFMNTARLGTAMQGVCHTERSYQGALPWVMERRSMRALTGKKDPDEVADRIIHHGDVRKNMLHMKAIAEGGRMMTYEAALIADSMLDPDPKVRDRCEAELGLLTPTLKAFLTEIGFECTALGMQVYGGAGFIKDYGMEQILRDCKISTLYEGTTGVQGLDLIGRKIIADKGVSLKNRATMQIKTAANIAVNGRSYKYGYMKHAGTIGKMSAQWLTTTAQIVMGAAKTKDQVGTASTDYMMFNGYLLCGFAWLQMMDTAAAALDKGDLDEENRRFYEQKLETGLFYMDRLLPKGESHRIMSLKDSSSIMKIDDWTLATDLPSDSGNAYAGYKAE